MSVGDYSVRYRDSQDMWIVIGENASKASKKLPNKKAAVRVGKRLARENGVSLTVYTRDGRPMEEDRYDMSGRESKTPY